MNRVICNKISLKNLVNNFNTSRNFSGEWGSGTGKGGGSGGTIRSAGGSFGKLEAAREEEFFRRKQREQLDSLRKSLEAQRLEIEKQIQRHDAELERLSEITKKND